ncbi:MAG: hypothetical protein ACREOK_05255 [Gemmatimonadaceae bacterium]
MRVLRNSLSALLLGACVAHSSGIELPESVASSNFGERIRVLDLYPGVTATVVEPRSIDPGKPVELILYALPNGNSTAETMGRAPFDSSRWRYDIQHIAAQTRALRARGLEGLGQAIMVYLEADGKSWPAWRQQRGYERANARIRTIVEQLRGAVGSASRLDVTLTGHSGGGSFIFGLIDAESELPDWVDRIAFLDANYSFEPRHGDRIADWLERDARHTLIVLAYDDREITLNGKKVVSDSGGTWRASQRMIQSLMRHFVLNRDTVGDFVRYSHPQIEILLHPNRENRILHTAMIGEMNGYMHALLARRPGYERHDVVLQPSRAYTQWVDTGVTLPRPVPATIPPRQRSAMGGRAFIASVANATREARETAIRREVLSGNIPSFLRQLRTVTDTVVGSDGVSRTIDYEVMPDYLAIGPDEDFVRMPMDPYTAQAFCDAFGFVLPTRKMVNDIWAAASVRVEPRPLTRARESPETFLQHHDIIEGQLAGSPRGAFVAGIKKDVVVTNQLRERANRVAIYGWHYLSGKPIQPLYSGHVDWYVDYSHGIRPVRRIMRVDGKARSYEEILADRALAVLLSDEGVIPVSRYDR